jgi:hypothetical protein
MNNKLFILALILLTTTFTIASHGGGSDGSLNGLEFRDTNGFAIRNARRTTDTTILSAIPASMINRPNRFPFGIGTATSADSLDGWIPYYHAGMSHNNLGCLTLLISKNQCIRIYLQLKY